MAVAVAARMVVVLVIVVVAVATAVVTAAEANTDGGGDGGSGGGSQRPGAEYKEMPLFHTMARTTASCWSIDTFCTRGRDGCERASGTRGGDKLHLGCCNRGRQ
jgi:hypothetical protein